MTKPTRLERAIKNLKREYEYDLDHLPEVKEVIRAFDEEQAALNAEQTAPGDCGHGYLRTALCPDRCKVPK